MMSKVILDLAVTLDGFIEGTNGETDWCIMDDDMDFEGFLSGIDTIFYGRVSYDQWGKYQPQPNASATEKAIWKAVHAKKKIVFTSQQRKEDNVIFINTNIPQRVAEIKAADGKDIWLYGGASLITTFMEHNLVDVYRISVHPTVLGSGKPLFANGQQRINLKLSEVNRFRSGVVQLIYEQLK